MNESTATSLLEKNDAATLDDLYLALYISLIEAEMVGLAQQISPSINSVGNALKILGTATVESFFQTATRLVTLDHILRLDRQRAF